MKLVLDACVLYPTVMREMLLGAARAGAFAPLWSPRILEEWARAARRLGPEGEAQARGEIALLRAGWPKAEMDIPKSLQARLWLPDENDIHVLALAVAGSADGIVTMNARDFPRGILAEEGVARYDPDGLMTEALSLRPDAITELATGVLARARDMSGEDWQIRALMKKARLPRLGKALERYGD